MNQRRDVIIVGAGPVGLTLARGLALDGKKVLVLEKKTHLSQYSKAATLWPKTQELLNDLGILSEFQDHSIKKTELQMTNADSKKESKILTLPLSELSQETKFPELLILPQNVTESILYQSLKREENIEVIFDAEVINFQEDLSEIHVQYKKDGEIFTEVTKFVVGCDGAHSFVREKLGFKLEGETYQLKASIADIKLGDKKSYSFPRLSTQGGLSVGIELSDNLWRLILIDKLKAKVDLDERIRKAVHELFHQKNYALLWQSQFHLHRRTSENFAKGRMVLAGDAAHLNSPVGGQGMNAGMQDTAILRSYLNHALQIDSPSPLATYARRRKTAIKKGVNKATGLMTSILLLRNGTFVKPILRGLNLLLKIPKIRHEFLRKTAMLE